MRGARGIRRGPGDWRFKREIQQWHHRLKEQGTGITYDSATEINYDDTDWTYDGSRVTP